MTTQEVKRKLAAILSADVKGYSRLMGADEEGTLHTLTAYREVIITLIQQHRGRVVNAPGDALLAEFESVVDAVKSAIEIQRELAKRNADLPADRQMEYRIGINLGDVLVDGESIYGDGVNIAARMESLAEAGGICISGTAYDQVENKLSLGYEYLGEQAVKNIVKPIRVYRVLTEPELAGKVIGQKRKAKPRQWQRAAFVAVAILIVVAASIATWKFYIRPSAPLEVAAKEKMAYPLPDVPSIAVMPFVNMSGDPKQEFLSDGITENIITALSKVPRLFVISRQSTFFYKGKPVKVKQVSEELGVQYVLEGSVQRSADRIRINAQLIDALTGNHLWAERYDRDLKDLFALQDEITMKVLTAAQVKLKVGEESLTIAKYFKGKQGLDCYLRYLEGINIFYGFNIEAARKARRIVEELIGMCPDNPAFYVALGYICHFEFTLGIGKSPRESIENGIEMAQKALAMDDSMPEAHALLSWLYSYKREYDKAIAEAERLVALDPGWDWAYATYAKSLSVAGRSEEAIPIFQKAIRLNPFGGSTLLDFGVALREVGRYEEAVSAFKKVLQRAPNNFLAHIHLTGAYGLMGREKEARAEAEEVIRLNPKFSLESYAKILPYKNQIQTDRYIDALRKAGLPEKPSASIPPSAEVAPKEKVTPPLPEKVTKPAPPPAPKIEVASKEKMAFPLPDKPSIAVLAFTNIGGGKELEYFSDGLAEGIIDGLSKSEHIFVIARNSSFTYKGKPVKVKQVAEEMGVRYVMEGSVQQERNRVRITAQLIDALTGRHLFSERYDRDLKDILNLQDEITLKVLTAVHVKLVTGESVRGLEKGTKNLDAYLKVLQAREHKGGTFNKERVERARQLLEEAIVLDPEYAVAYSFLSTTYFDLVVLGASDSPRESLRRAVELGEKAIALDDSNSTIHAGLTFPYIYIREYDKAISEAEKAISLSPNSAAAYWALGSALTLSGRAPQEAIPMLQKSLRLSPVPVHSQVLGILATSYTMLGQDEEAIAIYKKVLQIYGPDHLMAHLGLIGAYVRTGRENEARSEGAEVLRIDPKFSIERYLKGLPMDQSRKERMAENLRKAGLK